MFDWLIRDKKLERDLLFAKWEVMRNQPPPTPPLTGNENLGELILRIYWRDLKRNER